MGARLSQVFFFSYFSLKIYKIRFSYVFLWLNTKSGAGKTTLLNFLTCRNLDNYETSGKIRINGKIVGVDEVTRKSAYVQQDDLFLGYEF